MTVVVPVSVKSPSEPPLSNVIVCCDKKSLPWPCYKNFFKENLKSDFINDITKIVTKLDLAYLWHVENGWDGYEYNNFQDQIHILHWIFLWRLSCHLQKKINFLHIFNFNLLFFTNLLEVDNTSLHIACWTKTIRVAQSSKIGRVCSWPSTAKWQENSS